MQPVTEKMRGDSVTLESEVRAPASVVASAPIDGFPLSLRAGYLLRRTHRLQGQLWSAAAPPSLTSPQFGVLSVVDRYPGIDQRSVGRRVSLDRASVAGIVSRLVRSGALVSERDPLDARRNRLTLTPAYRPRIPQYRAVAAGVWDDIFGPLAPEDRPRFVELLNRLARFTPVEPDSGALFRRLEQKRTTTWSEVVGDVFTGSQYAVLHVVGRSPGVNQKELGELAALDKSTAAEIVARLADRDWIRRDIAPTDGRVRQLFLTTEALELVQRMKPRLDHVQERLLDPLTHAEVATLLEWWALVAYRGNVPPSAR